jgi:hypothetical protein
MILSTTTSGVASAAAACVFATALGACAARADAAVDAAPALRVVVDLVRGSDDASGIAAEATRIAGLPVRYAAATSTTRHALVVECPSAERCAAALARLRGASTIYRAVEIDGRKTRSAS